MDDRSPCTCVNRGPSSTNAVSFSSARTMKRLPSLPCASTIQIVRPSQSTAETQPKLHPAFLRLSAMTFQYYTANDVSDCSKPFAVRSCSVQASHSLSAGLAVHAEKRATTERVSKIVFMYRPSNASTSPRRNKPGDVRANNAF